MPLPLVAVPVIHSAGGWIASTSAGGYLAGTLSSTWAGAFIAGNAGALMASGVATATAVGGYIAGATGSAAVALGLAPATFLGLTPVGWAIAGGALTVTGTGLGLAYWKSRKFRAAVDEVLDHINAERIKGGLAPFTSAWDLIRGLKKEYAAEPAVYQADFDFDEVR
jgi:hypothetical protein